jgi:hypothetical protein
MEKYFLLKFSNTGFAIKTKLDFASPSHRMNQLEEGQGRMASTDVLLDVDIRLDAVEDRLAGVNMEQVLPIF